MVCIGLLVRHTAYAHFYKLSIVFAAQKMLCYYKDNVTIVKIIVWTGTVVLRAQQKFLKMNHNGHIVFNYIMEKGGGGKENFR